MHARIRSGDLKITGAHGFWTIDEGITTGYPIRSLAMPVTGLYREDSDVPDTMLTPISEFPERRFWLPQKVIEETWPFSMECFMRDYKTEFYKSQDDGLKEVRKPRPLVHIEYVVDPNQGRIITKIAPSGSP